MEKGISTLIVNLERFHELVASKMTDLHLRAWRGWAVPSCFLHFLSAHIFS